MGVLGCVFGHDLLVSWRSQLTVVGGWWLQLVEVKRGEESLWGGFYSLFIVYSIYYYVGHA